MCREPNNKNITIATMMKYHNITLQRHYCSALATSYCYIYLYLLLTLHTNDHATIATLLLHLHVSLLIAYTVWIQRWYKT